MCEMEEVGPVMREAATELIALKAEMYSTRVTRDTMEGRRMKAILGVVARLGSAVDRARAR